MSRFVLTAQLQLQAPNNVAQVVRQIQSQLNNVTVNVQVQGAQQAQRQIQQITQNTNNATTAAERMGRAFAVSVRRFAAFSIATRAVGLFTSTLGDAVQTAIDFERQLVKISQVTGESVSKLGKLTSTITDLSTGLGVSSQSLLEVSTILLQAGLNSKDTEVALKSLARAALAPNFDSITETAEGAIAILAQFQEGVGSLEKQLGSINAVAGAFAVEASDLIDVIRRTGGVFKASGGNLNELLALFTSVRATTRESAESIGTGLRTIFTRIQRPKTIEFLKQFGVELVDLEGKFVGPFEAVRRLSSALAGLGEGDLTFIRIAEELGGFRQIGKVLPLLQQFSTAQAALNVAQKSGNSLAQDAATAQQALAIRITKVKEEFLALVRSVTETATFQIMANTALSLATALIKLSDSIKPLLPLLGALAAIRIARGLGSFIGGIGGGLASARTFNKGGKVHHFARGGMVPGTGNRDTVPAMLSPGEFVIRKSSVQKLGAANLAAMNENRFNKGIRVTKAQQAGMSTSDVLSAARSSVTIPRFAKESSIGIATTSYLPSLSTGNISVTREDILNQIPGGVGTSLAQKFGAKEAKDALGTLFKGKNKFNYSSVIEGVGKDEESKFANIINESISSAIDISANRFATEVMGSSGPLKINKLQSFYNTLDQGFRGQLFESTISALAGKPLSGQDSRRPIDFTRGIGKFKSIYSNLGMDYVDAKITSGAAGLGKTGGLTSSGSQGLASKIAQQLSLESMPFINSLIPQKTAEQKQKELTSKALMGKGKAARKHFGGIIQKFAKGGIAQAPLIDDIVNATGTMMPRPSSAIAALIHAGGGAIDIDRTIKRTVGDKAYGMAKTSGQQSAVLDKFFRDPQARLRDVTSAPLTTFGKELQSAIKSGQLQPGKLSIVSKSQRVPGVAEYLSNLFGIPLANMIFTGGGSKQPAMDALRNKGSRVDRVAKFATGGSVRNPKDTLARYFEKSSTLNAGILNRGILPRGGQGRKEQADRMRDMRSLETVAPQMLYNSLSRKAFDSMASQVGLNKNPEIPAGTKYSDQEKILSKEVSQIVGKSFRLQGYLSTSKDYSKAKTFLDNAPRFKDGWAAMLSILTKAGSRGVDVVDQLKDRKVGGMKIDKSTGQSLYQKPPESEDEFLLRPGSKFKIDSAKFAKLGTNKNLWMNVKQFATGGGVGTDTVPALLTPGEFVINRSAAQNIGYGALNRMNKVGRYAKGGVVQRFNRGGTARMPDASSRYGAGFIGSGGLDSSQNFIPFDMLSTQANNLANAQAALVGSTQQASQSTQQVSQAQQQQNRTIGEAVAQNKLFLASMATSLIQGFLPAIDDNSGAVLKLTHSFLGFTTTVFATMTALEAFGISMKKQAVMNFLGGKGIGIGGMKSMLERGFNPAIVRSTQALAKLAGPIMAVVGGAALAQAAFNSIAESIFNFEGRLNKAIQSGNVSEARSVAFEKARFEKSFGTTGGITAATSAGVAIGSFIPVIGNLVGGLIGFGVGLVGVASNFETTIKSAVDLAAAQAGAISTQKSLDQAQKTATTAMQDFEKGTITASEALARIRTSTESATIQQNRTLEFAQSNADNRQYDRDGNRTWGGYFRDVRATATFGYVDSAQERDDKLGAQSAEMIRKSNEGQARAFEMQSPARQAAIRSGLARGQDPERVRREALGVGTNDDRLKRLRELSDRATNLANKGDTQGAAAAQEAFIQLKGQIDQINAEFINLEKEVARARAAFDAMNLGLRGAEATSTAMSASMTRFASRFEAGTSTFVSDAEFLREAVSSAAQAMDPADIKNAISNVAQNLEQLGVSPAFVSKFENNTNAFVAAQQKYSQAFENVRQRIGDKAFKGLDADNFSKELATELSNLVGGPAKENLKKAIEGISLTDDEIDQIIGGNYEVFGNKLGEAQQKQIESIIKIAQERQKAEQVIIQLTQKRIEAERKLVEAQQEALDLYLEGREVQAGAGGRAVTGAERRGVILGKANVEGDRLGLTGFRSGSAEELRRRNMELRVGAATYEQRASTEGGLQGASGVEASEQQRDLQKAYRTQIETIRSLIKLEQDELKIIQEKNKLEKQSMESLISGDIQKFFEQQAAVGATAAIATGNKTLMNQFGASALGAAYQDIQRQQEAGVQSIYGVRLAGAGGLGEQAAQAALSARGVTSPASAQMLAGTTPEEEAKRARIRELGGVLGETGQVGIDMAQMELNTAEIVVAQANIKLQDIIDRGNNAAAGFARGGMVYASRGMFIPRGTDTVPAMLTPGEFVVNRRATQNNLELLKSINNGNNTTKTTPTYASRGGQIRGGTQYLSGGGTATQSVSLDPQVVARLSDALMTFNRDLAANVVKLQSTKFQIKLETANININLQGASFLSSLRDQIQKELFAQLAQELTNYRVGPNGNLMKSSSVL